MGMWMEREEKCSDEKSRCMRLGEAGTMERVHDEVESIVTLRACGSAGTPPTAIPRPTVRLAVSAVMSSFPTFISIVGRHCRHRRHPSMQLPWQVHSVSFSDSRLQQDM